MYVSLPASLIDHEPHCSISKEALAIWNALLHAFSFGAVTNFTVCLNKFFFFQANPKKKNAQGINSGLLVGSCG